MQKPTLVCAAFAAAVFAPSIAAQCADPVFGTAVSSGAYQDDVVLPMQPLGFAFPFHGATYTDVHACTNGFLYLSNAGVPAVGGAQCCTGDVADLVASTAPMIAPFWSDLVCDPADGAVVSFSAQTGRATITWSNVRELGNTELCTFQVQLLQTGEIMMTWDDRCQIRTTGDFLVGISEGGGAAVPLASDFLTTNVSTTTTCFELFTSVGSFDLDGQAVLFVPTGPTGFAWVPQPCPSGATQAFGLGCYASGDSFYQLTVAPVDSSAQLSNTAITMLPAGNEFVVINGGAYVPPTGAATAITLTDDSSAATPTLTTPFPYQGGALTQFQVCSNGQVWAGTGNSTAYAPDVDVMLSNNPAAGWYAWHDYNPGAAGSGSVKFEEVGGIVYITWDGVYNYSGTSAADATYLQFQFDTSVGTVVIAFGTVSAMNHTGFTTGQPHLVGYSPGGTSLDFGSMTFASDLPHQTSAVDLVPMTLSAAPNASIGGTVVYTADNLPEFGPSAGVYLTTLIFSVGALPNGVDLGIIGAPGCRAYIASLDWDIGGQVATTPTASWNLPISSMYFAIGNQFAAQAVALVQPNSLPNGQNQFGMTTSNGVLTTVGAW